jgi:cytochrome c-type biogenesis protein
LPGLIDFYEQYGDDERFEILAFHDGSVKDFAELDEKTAGAKEKYWSGRDLPFPVLLDASGDTIEQYGIHAFPTMILVDPDGKLVSKTHGVDDLKSKLGITDPPPSGDDDAGH